MDWKNENNNTETANRVINLTGDEKCAETADRHKGLDWTTDLSHMHHLGTHKHNNIINMPERHGGERLQQTHFFRESQHGNPREG